MTFRIYGEIELDGDTAKTSVENVSGAVRKLEGSAGRFNAAGHRMAATTGTIGRQSNFAAGAIGNMIAQGNDIVTMMFAMQNPMQLAIQQGTQITQVFGNRGAAQAGAMLKQALVSMISPLNLITIGGLAAGAAIIQFGVKAVSAGDDVDEMAKKIEAARDKIKDLEEDVGRLELGLGSTEEHTLVRAIEAARKDVLAAQQKANDADVEAVIFAERELEAARKILETREKELENLRNLTAEQERLKDEEEAQADREKAELAAEDELATLRSQAEIMRLISIHGEESRQVATARVQAERDAFLQTKLSEEISAELVVQLMRAWDAANGVADVDMHGNITLAADEAARLAENLNISLNEANALMAQRNPQNYSGRGSDPRKFDTENRFGGGQFVPTQEVIAAADELLRPPRTKSGARGGAANAAKREREAVKNLIETLQQQLDIARETDPVQQAMIRNRDVLKAATEAERKSVQELIATRISEEAAIDRATERAEAFGDLTEDTLEGILDRGRSAADVIDDLAESFRRAALYGTGPLAELLGLSDSGGLIGIATSYLFPGDALGQADGGMQYGPGGPRDDLLPRWLSAGEFVVNGKATAQNRALLEYINNGGLVSSFGMANGGIAAPAVPAVIGSAVGGGPGGRLVIQIVPSPLFEAQTLETAQDVTVQVLDNYRASGLPNDLNEISADPSRYG